MKESKYVRLAYIIYRVLRNSRIPLFLHRKSNHVFSLWQHIVLLTVRQYEGKSYRMFVEWLAEAYYLRMFLQLSHIPHFGLIVIQALRFRVEWNKLLDVAGCTTKLPDNQFSRYISHYGYCASVSNRECWAFHSVSTC